MRCPQCHTENRVGRKFCAACGQALTLTCPACGFVNAPDDRFCGGCGQALMVITASELANPIKISRLENQPPLPGTASPVTPHALDAERRQLTVMFCDLADSTPLSEQLDPEDLREIVRAYQRTCAEVLQGVEGHIAQYLGDGLLVYFGWPQAHDNDAQRAVQAGLSILEAMQMLNTQLERDKGLRLAVRVGIHTGVVVVGAIGGGGRPEQLALGDTPNVAARIQGLAEPDTVLIGAATQRLVQGYFTMAALGPQTLKGVAAPVPVYRILGASKAQSRLDVAATTGLTPLVGRESDMTLLLERWEQSKAGLGQVVLLSGEGGIGKSRLVEVVRQRVVGEGSRCIMLRCSPYHTNSALYPLIEHLQQWLQFQREDSPDVKLRKLEEALISNSLPPRGQRPGMKGDRLELVTLLASLLSVPLPEGDYPPVLLTPHQQRQRTLDALVAWLLTEGERQPALAVWEDLHWADPSTLELLGLVVEQAPTARLLTLVTARPEFRSPWVPHSHVTQLTLGRLPRSQVDTMVQQLTGGKPFPAEVLEQVIAKTDGVPLFVEELVKMILESRLVREEADRYTLPGPLPPLAIPATLQDSLMARLDRLATARVMAQLGAVLGREFAYELIEAVALLDEATVQRGLAQLVDAELLYQRGRPPQARYLFKHALIQETAYRSLLKSTRQQYHQRSAQILAAQFPEIVETQPELLAHHYTEAGLTEQAILYWQQAGQQALQRSANSEAAQHLSRGLALLATLPDTPARATHELRLLTILGPALMATQGYASPEAGSTYARARELCQQVEETPQLARVFFGLWVFYHARAEHPIGRELSEQFLTVAHRVQDSALLLVGHQMLGQSLFCLGESAQARALFEQALTYYDPRQHRELALLYGTDPVVASLAWLSWSLWLLGYPDHAQQQTHAALTLADELGHSLTRGSALAWAAFFHSLGGNGQATFEQAEAAVRLSTEQALPFRVSQGMILRGWALATLGDVEQGRAQLRQGLEGWRATGAAISWSYWLGLLADSYAREASIEEGLAVVAEALTCVDQTSERYAEAELHRLKGELLLKQTFPDAHQSEACFQQALDVARSQQAKSWELRTATSLSRLWQQQGKRDEARELLAAIYGWFTEGFDTADLQEAKALLDVLA